MRVYVRERAREFVCLLERERGWGGGGGGQAFRQGNRQAARQKRGRTEADRQNKIITQPYS